MEQIRYVKIPTTERRADPDTHVAYGLQVQGPVRSWTVWHRYSDFTALEYELGREFPGVVPPGPLPPKSLTSWFSKLPAIGSGGTTGVEVEFVEERRRALERYIQSMIMSDDDRWRTSRTLQAFLAPATRGARHLAGKNGGGPGPGLSRPASETESVGSEAGWVTPASWLADQRDAEQVVRNVRQSILRRENALTRNEVSVSHQALLEAKRQLGDLGRSIAALDSGLEQTKAALAAGELLRRQDMLMRLGEDKANLTRIVMGSGVMPGGSGRTALLDGASSGSSGARVIGRAGAAAAASESQYSMPGGMPTQAHGVAQQGDASRAARSRRIFGNANPPQETDETRGLDNRGLLQLQTDKMRDQDRAVAAFSEHLRRQREMGLAIGNELDLQNQLLSELDQDLDRTGNKLAAARRQANRL